MHLEDEHFRAARDAGLLENTRIWRSTQHTAFTAAAVARKSIVHVPDFGTIDLPIPRAAAALEGARTSIRSEETAPGYISIYRQEVRPFAKADCATRTSPPG